MVKVGLMEEFGELGSAIQWLDYEMKGKANGFNAIAHFEGYPRVEHAPKTFSWKHDEIYHAFGANALDEGAAQILRDVEKHFSPDKINCPCVFGPWRMLLICLASVFMCVISYVCICAVVRVRVFVSTCVNLSARAFWFV